MKNLLVLVCLLTTAVAFATPAPFQPWVKDIVSKGVMDLDSGKVMVGDSSGKAQAVSVSGDVTMSNAGVVLMGDASVDGLMRKRVARATYDVAVDGGTAGAYGLGVSLPANAIITRSWFYTVTQFVDGGAGTVALHCETANNIFSAADITGNADGTLVDGIQDGTFANFDGTGAAGVLGSACELTATVATAEQTAGKLVLFVEYVVAE
jgi:hypothetical protein